MINCLLKIVLIFLSFTLMISCNKPGGEDLTKPLVYKNGLLFSDSLSTNPFTGRHKSRMRDMKIEYEVVNGVREGDFIIYFSNNNVHMSGQMLNNKNEGEWKYYFSNGALQTSGFFENDIPSGKWTWYSLDGRILEQGNFLDGSRDGEWKSYDSLGQVDIIRIYKLGEMIDSTKIG